MRSQGNVADLDMREHQRSQYFTGQHEDFIEVFGADLVKFYD